MCSLPVSASTFKLKSKGKTHFQAARCLLGQEIMKGNQQNIDNC